MKVNTTQAYVYQHVRLDTNEVFYVGISHSKGTKSNKYYRAHEKWRRSKFWKAIANKTKYKVEILFNNLTWQEAIHKEIELIRLHGRRDLGLGTLCNLTDGGEGMLGGIVIMSETRRTNISNARLHNSRLRRGNQQNMKTRLAYGWGSLVLNLETGIYYDSVSEAARAHDINPATLHDYLGRYNSRNSTSLIKIDGENKQSIYK